MNLNPRFPGPLRGKVAGWGLPRCVEVEFLKTLKQKLDGFPVLEYARCKPYEFMIPDPSGDDLYCFYGRIAMRIYRGGPTLVDCDFDYFVHAKDA